MTTITHGVGKSRNLTPAEVDANFDALDASITAKSTAETPVNNLLSTDTTKALAASQGPVLSNSIAVASSSAATASASAASAAATALLADQKATTATANVATLTTTVTALSSTKADLASP